MNRPKLSKKQRENIAIFPVYLLLFLFLGGSVFALIVGQIYSAIPGLTPTDGFSAVSWQREVWLVCAVLLGASCLVAGLCWCSSRKDFLIYAAICAVIIGVVWRLGVTMTLLLLNSGMDTSLPVILPMRIVAKEQRGQSRVLILRDFEGKQRRCEIYRDFFQAVKVGERKLFTLRRGAFNIQHVTAVD